MIDPKNTGGGSGEDQGIEKYPLISEEELQGNLRLYGLPKYYKNPDLYTEKIHELVSVIKGLKQVRQPFLKEWQELKNTIDVGVVTENTRLIDDFVLAWQKALPDLATVLLHGGDASSAVPDNYKTGKPKMLEDSFVMIVPGSGEKGEPSTIYAAVKQERENRRSFTTWLIVDCIRRLQFQLKRVPSRKEILDDYALQDPKGCSIDEMSRQLGKLGWQDRIPPQSAVKAKGDSAD